MPRHALAAPMLSLLVAVTALAAEPVQLLYSTIPGDPSNTVPGTPGLTFINLWRPYRSPNGKHWAMRINTDFFDGDSAAFVGSGLTGIARVYNGSTFPGAAAGEFITNVDHQFAIRDDGAFVTGVNTSFGGGPEPNPDEYILYWNGSAFSIAFNENDPVPGFPGSSFGAIMSEAHILNDGRIGFNSITSDGLPTDSNTLMMLDNTILAREGITIPTGQALGGTQPWDFFEFDGYHHSADGAHYLLFGDLRGSTNSDGVVVIDGHVALQEGVQIFPFVSPIGGGFSGLREGAMMTNGNWFFRGSNADGQDWVVRNGQTVAATNTPITTTSTELFSDAVPNTEGFTMLAGNNHGDYVVGGWTNNANPLLNSVVVLNRTTVVLREGDRVDLNGNCQADDDLFIDSFAADQAFLTDGPEVYFVANVRNAAGTQLGEALMRYCLSSIPADLDCDGDVDSEDETIFVALLLAGTSDCRTTSRADLTGDGAINGGDIQQFVDARI